MLRLLDPILRSMQVEGGAGGGGDRPQQPRRKESLADFGNGLPLADALQAFGQAPFSLLSSKRRTAWENSMKNLVKKEKEKGGEVKVGVKETDPIPSDLSAFCRTAETHVREVYNSRLQAKRGVPAGVVAKGGCTDGREVEGAGAVREGREEKRDENGMKGQTEEHRGKGQTE
eukprot:Cvel_18941.t1-p1 / transcript=Cvel_18941.t1 / gene=Cvel_18941 / organism=Chromera_velia_CCMP2878 / gene_product=hypothetical protein / transcript_product=hypothetical protein / location=Cvel_scaffold1599:33533-34048(+) / protein_length=172 / sequence_SO=supercontig / SO=protein_coding / is_pseudo=false